MGLIVFTYFFAVLLLWYSIYLSLNQSKQINILLNRIAVSAVIAAFCLAFAIHLIFYQRMGLQRIMSTLSMLFVLLSSYYILDFALTIPEFKTNKIGQTINIGIHLAGIAIVFFLIQKLSWTPLFGFYFVSYKLIKGFDGLHLFAALYLFGIPISSILISLLKIFFVKSNIHRQQLILHSLAIAVCLTVWVLMLFAMQIFSWAFALLPIGYIFMLVLDSAVFSLTRVFDVKRT